MRGIGPRIALPSILLGRDFWCVGMGKMTRAVRHSLEAAQSQKLKPFAVLRDTISQAKTDANYNELVRRGSHPLHAVYAATINLVSTFLECTQDLRPFRTAVKFIAAKQDLYMPSFPPMSPLTTSYFTTWTHLDAQFGSDRESVADCLAGVLDVFQIREIQQKALERLRISRLGIYELIGKRTEGFQLRELVTGTQIEALIPSGFHGVPGEILLIRLLPPLESNPSYHVAVTTPYILHETPETRWLEYFVRHQIEPGTAGFEERLHRHMKWGPKPDYWSEFVFFGCVNHRSDAIFLTGYPDRPETQPHHKSLNILRDT